MNKNTETFATLLQLHDFDPLCVRGNELAGFSLERFIWLKSKMYYVVLKGQEPGNITRAVWHSHEDATISFSHWYSSHGCRVQQCFGACLSEWWSSIYLKGFLLFLFNLLNLPSVLLHPWVQRPQFILNLVTTVSSLWHIGPVVLPERHWSDLPSHHTHQCPRGCGLQLPALPRTESKTH